jgi:hypothetical protein
MLLDHGAVVLRSEAAFQLIASAPAHDKSNRGDDENGDDYDYGDHNSAIHRFITLRHFDAGRCGE